MSHFAVAIISDDTKTIEELLAPYQENNMGDCPREYLEFNDITEEYQHNYKKADEEIKTKYPTFEQYMEDYCGYTLDEEKKAYGYWENPNKKWDWYVIGGRWSKSLLGKDGQRYDSLKIKDIDFDAMTKERRVSSEKTWNEVKGINDDFDSMIENGGQLTNNKPKDAAYAAIVYGITPDETKENYLERTSRFETFAVITPDGEWRSKGEMGWWGIHDATNENQKDWNKSYYEVFLKDANPEHTFTIVDCHI